MSVVIFWTDSDKRTDREQQSSGFAFVLLVCQSRAFVKDSRLLRNLSRYHVYRCLLAARDPQTSTMELNVVGRCPRLGNQLISSLNQH